VKKVRSEKTVMRNEDTGTCKEGFLHLFKGREQDVKYGRGSYIFVLFQVDFI
jgi:hypothetical protein